MSDTVEKILACRKEVEREIGRPLSAIEQNIVRVAFLNGQNGVYNDIAARTAETEKEVEEKTAEVDKQSATIKALQVKINQKHISSQE